jgi:hypothetical protein
MQNESLNLGTGSLYSAFPIPSYQVLAKAKEYNAQRVLMCLVSLNFLPLPDQATNLCAATDVNLTDPFKFCELKNQIANQAHCA